MAACCPVIRVKCSRRKVKGKLKCTVRMAGKKWRTSPEKAKKKVAQLQERLSKKGCRGDVQGAGDLHYGSGTKADAARTDLRRIAVMNFPKRRQGWVAQNQARSTQSWPPAKQYQSSWPQEEAPYPGYPGTEE